MNDVKYKLLLKEDRMFLVAIFIGILIGLFRKGRFSRFEYAKFNLTSLLYVAVILYIAIIIMNLGLFDYNSSLYSIFLLVTYLFVAAFLATNLSTSFMFVPLIGIILNLIAFISNSFKFPISDESAKFIYGEELHNLLINDQILFFTPAKDATLGFLGNIINIGNFFIVSIGDIILYIGIILIIQSIMTDKYIQSRSKITFSKDMF